MRIIPAIDIIGGNCVRLSQGKYDSVKQYHNNPVDVAKNFEDAGIKYLHLVDLDGAKSKKIMNHKVLENICLQTSLHVDFGGGLQSDEDIRIAFDCGAKQITGGSIVVKKPEIFEEWLLKYGNTKIILGADAKNENIAVSGWEEDSKLDIYSYIQKYQKKGIQYVISTDVSKDGMLSGPSFELYNKILNQNNSLFLIASGGIHSLEDLFKLKEAKLEGAIIGKAIYEGYIKIEDLGKMSN